jgi:cbb3-type cytochrome oxidase maturation protein
MSAFIVLIGVSLVVAGGFLIAFLYNAKSGQFDDDITPSVRMLFDNHVSDTKNTSSTKTKK